MMKRIVFLAITSFLVAVVSFGQVTFEASTDANQVIKGNYLQVSFTLSNAEGTNFSPPSFDGFQVLSGPGRSMSTTIINGKRTSSQAFNYTLLATATGVFNIGSARITVGNKVLKSNPLRIEVMEGRKTGTAGASDIEEAIELRAVLSDTTAWIGQQVVLDYKIYTTKDIDSYNLVSESDYDGLYIQEIRRFDNNARREVIDGVQYTTKILKRVAIFPQQAGKFTIEPMTLRLGIPTESEANRRGFFLFKDVNYVNIGSDAVELEVSSLPPAPAGGFSGAVGKYEFSAHVNSNDISTDDALSVKCEIQGNGDPRRLLPSPMNFPEGFEEYDPNVTSENTLESGGEWLHTAVIEYVAVPEKTGRFTITPHFTYFDTDSAAYITLRGDSTEVFVSQGSTRPGTTFSGKPPGGNKKDIRYIWTSVDEGGKKRQFFGSPVFFILLISPFLAFLTAFFIKRKKEQTGRMDISILKQKRAIKIAEKRLTKARAFMESGNSKDFYEEISRTLFGYASDKLGIPFSALTKGNINRKLVSLEVESVIIERFMKVVKTCEMALFAGMDNPSAMSEVYNETLEIIKNMEVQLDKSPLTGTLAAD